MVISLAEHPTDQQYRAIWHVLRILLHRPFVLDSDPNVRDSQTTHACIEVCTTEAANIVQSCRSREYLPLQVRQGHTPKDVVSECPSLC